MQKTKNKTNKKIMNSTLRSITKKDLREGLPGFEKQIILASESDTQKKLIYIYSIVGCFDELIEKHNYQIHLKDGKIIPFMSLNKAFEAWENHK